MTSTLECVLDIRASLGESPIWSSKEQALYWVDINAPSLNRFDPSTRENQTWPMPASIGSIGLRADGGLVVALRDGIWLAGRDGTLERKVADAPYDASNHRFNDGRVDPSGGFCVGGMNERRDANSAAMYRLDSNFRLTVLFDDIMISNGLAWSPDGRTMYHADTPTHTINAFDFDPRGTVSNKREFAHFPAANDRPDGAAVDREGCYWSAFYRGGKIVRLSPQGELLSEYAVPAMCPTMCAFGGPDLKTLYVTSARQLREAEELARLPQSGGIFAMRVDVPGMPEPEFAG